MKKNLYIINIFYGDSDDYVEHTLGACVGVERAEQIISELKEGNFDSIKPIFDDEGERSYKSINTEIMSLFCWDDSTEENFKNGRENFRNMFPDLYDDYMNIDLDLDRECEIFNEIDYRVFKKYYPELTREDFFDERNKQQMYEKIQEHWQDEDFGLYSQKIIEI